MIKSIQKGQSLFEVVLALGVITLITVGMVILATNSIKNATFSKNKNIATKYAQEAIEWLRSVRDTNPSLFIANSITASYCLDTLSWANTGSCGSSEYLGGTIYLRQVNFSSSVVSGKNLVEAEVVVSWSDPSGSHSVKSTTSFADYREK